MPKLISTPFQKVIAAVLALLTVFAFAWTVVPEANSQIAMQEAGTQSVVPEASQSLAMVVLPADTASPVGEVPDWTLEKLRFTDQAAKYESQGVVPEAIIQAQLAKVETQEIRPEHAPAVQTASLWYSGESMPEKLRFASQLAKYESQRVAPEAIIQAQLAKVETQGVIPSDLMPSSYQSV